MTAMVIVGLVLMLSPHSVFRPAHAPVAQPRIETAPGPAQALPPPAPVATAGTGLRVEIDAQRPCWVSAVADGDRVVFKTMQPGEHESIVVSNDLTLRVGDPDALTVTIDGVAARPLGRPGQPATVRISRENYREFLARNPATSQPSRPRG